MLASIVPRFPLPLLRLGKNSEGVREEGLETRLRILELLWIMYESIKSYCFGLVLSFQPLEDGVQVPGGVPEEDTRKVLLRDSGGTASKLVEVRGSQETNNKQTTDNSNNKNMNNTLFEILYTVCCSKSLKK